MDERRSPVPATAREVIKISEDLEGKIVAIFGRIPEVFPPYHNYYDTYSPNFISFELVGFDEDGQEAEFVGESQDQTIRVRAQYKVLVTEAGKKVLAKRTLKEKKTDNAEGFNPGSVEVEFRQGDFRLAYEVVYRDSKHKKVPNSVNFEVSATKDLDSAGTELGRGQSFDGESWNLSFAMDDISQIGRYSWFPHIEPRLTKSGRVRLSNYGKGMDQPEVIFNTKTGCEISHEYFDPYTYLIEADQDSVRMERSNESDVWSFQFPNKVSVFEIATFLEGDDWQQVSKKYPVNFNMAPNHKKLSPFGDLEN